MPHPEHTWWAPIRRGLVADPEGKHIRRLKGALALLLYLILDADWQSGRLRKKCETIASDMGHSRWTVRAWMRRLERHGYVRITKTGRARVIEVRKWRPRGHGSAPLTGTALPIRQARTQRELNGDRPGSQERRGQNGGEPVPNEKDITRGIERDNVVREGSIPDSDPEQTKEERLARTELLAQDLVAGLDDREHLVHYRAYAQRFPDSLLRRLLSEARATPDRSIKRSKAALFEFLLKQHVVSKNPSESNHPRN